MYKLHNVIFGLRLRITAGLVVIVLILAGIIQLAVSTNVQQGRLIYSEYLSNKKLLLQEHVSKTSDSLKTMANDYTYWDDMVNFVAEPSLERAEELLAGSLDTYNADAVWIYNTTPEAVYVSSNSETLDAEAIAPLTDAELDIITKIPDRFFDFYINTSLGILEVHGATVHPTNDADRLTEPRGYFFVGKLMGNDFVDEASSLLSADIRVVSNADEIPNLETVFLPKSGDYGFTTELHDIEGHVAGVIYASGYSDNIHRAIASQDDLTRNSTLLFIGIVVLAYFGLYALIIRPINKIAKALREKDDTHINKLKKRRDEFKPVADMISDSLGLLAKYDAIMSGISDGLVVFNKNGEVERVNKTAQALLGYEEGELIGNKFTDIVAAYDESGQLIPIDERPAYRALATKQPVFSEITYRQKNGQIFAAEVSVSPIFVKESLYGAVEILNDKTDEVNSRKAIEREIAEKTAELREVRARLEASINSLDVGFIITDKNNQIIIMNNSAKSMLSAEPQDHTRQWSYSELAEIFKDKINLNDAVRQCLDKWDPVTMGEIELDNKFLSLFIGPVLARSGEKNVEAIGCVILIEDITESSVAARSKEEFFSIASHELRTPLTSIRGNSAMILSYYKEQVEDPTLHEMIDDIHESSERLISIVNDFLDVSKIEQGKLKFEIDELDIGELIAEVTAELKNLAKDKNVELLSVTDGQIIPKVLADHDRTKQIIINLISNALKFTEDGEIRVSCSLEGSFVKVRFADSGKGIAEDQKQLLFRKFQQASNSIWTRETSKGTGLGLYISKLLVEGMGGNIRLESSEVNKGSVFSFTLPVDNELNRRVSESRHGTNDDIDTRTGLHQPNPTKQ